MWSKLEKPRTVVVNRSLVREFFEMESIGRERPLSERRVAIYKKLLEAGEFRPVTWASAYCEETGETYRVNGQHTSVMLNSMETLPDDFFVTVERYSCPDMEDVARLYSTFDSRLGVRNFNDVVMSFASTVPDFSEIRRKTLTLAVASLSYRQWGEGHKTRSAPERAELLLGEVDWTIWLDGILHPDRNQKGVIHILRSPVTTAMLGTWGKSKQQSDEFWKIVRDEEGPTSSSARVLGKYLVRTALMSNRMNRRPANIAPFREMYVKCIHAWNAWRKNTTTDLRYVPAAKIPAVQ